MSCDVGKVLPDIIVNCVFPPARPFGVLTPNLATSPLDVGLAGHCHPFGAAVLGVCRSLRRAMMLRARLTVLPCLALLAMGGRCEEAARSAAETTNGSEPAPAAFAPGDSTLKEIRYIAGEETCRSFLDNFVSTCQFATAPGHEAPCDETFRWKEARVDCMIEGIELCIREGDAEVATLLQGVAKEFVSMEQPCLTQEDLEYATALTLLDSLASFFSGRPSSGTDVAGPASGPASGAAAYAATPTPTPPPRRHSCRRKTSVVPGAGWLTETVLPGVHRLLWWAYRRRLKREEAERQLADEKAKRAEKTNQLNSARRVYKAEGSRRDLFAACSSGLAKMCKRELAGLATPNVVSTEAKASLVFLGAQSGDAATVQALLDAGADPYLGDSRGYTPLDVAMDQGFTAVARQLLEVGVEDRLHSDGFYSLHRAAWNGQVEALALVLSKSKAKLELSSLQLGQTLLMAAASKAATVSLKYLLGLGADVFTKDIQGRTALYHAVQPDLVKVRLSLDKLSGHALWVTRSHATPAYPCWPLTTRS